MNNDDLNDSSFNKEVKENNIFTQNIDSNINNVNIFNMNLNLKEDNIFNRSYKIDLSNTKHYNVKVIKKKEPLIKFVIGILSYALFIWLLLVGITLLLYVADIKIKELKGDYTPPKYNAYVVLSGSMLPEIQINDVVVTKKITDSDLKIGDVITFSSTDSRFVGTIITHRIIDKQCFNGICTFQTKGDNNTIIDEALVQSNNIYGKVIYKIPKLGYLQVFLAQRGGWIIVILLPCLSIISYDILKLVKSIKNKKQRKLIITNGRYNEK